MAARRITANKNRAAWENKGKTNRKIRQKKLSKSKGHSRADSKKAVRVRKFVHTRSGRLRRTIFKWKK